MSFLHHSLQLEIRSESRYSKHTHTSVVIKISNGTKLEHSLCFKRTGWHL